MKGEISHATLNMIIKIERLLLSHIVCITSTHSEPIRAAVLDSTHSMYQLEILGASLLLKLLVTDLALNTLFRDWCSLDFDVVVW